MREPFMKEGLLWLLVLVIAVVLVTAILEWLEARSDLAFARRQSRRLVGSGSGGVTVEDLTWLEDFYRSQVRMSRLDVGFFAIVCVVMVGESYNYLDRIIPSTITIPLIIIAFILSEWRILKRRRIRKSMREPVENGVVRGEAQDTREREQDQRDVQQEERRVGMDTRDRQQSDRGGRQDERGMLQDERERGQSG